MQTGRPRHRGAAAGRRPCRAPGPALPFSSDSDQTPPRPPRWPLLLGLCHPPGPTPRQLQDPHSALQGSAQWGHRPAFALPLGRDTVLVKVTNERPWPTPGSRLAGGLLLADLHAPPLALVPRAASRPSAGPTSPAGLDSDRPLRTGQGRPRPLGSDPHVLPRLLIPPRQRLRGAALAVATAPPSRLLQPHSTSRAPHSPPVPDTLCHLLARLAWLSGGHLPGPPDPPHPLPRNSPRVSRGWE